MLYFVILLVESVFAVKIADISNFEGICGWNRDEGVQGVPQCMRNLCTNPVKDACQDVNVCVLGMSSELNVTNVGQGTCLNKGCPGILPEVMACDYPWKEPDGGIIMTDGTAHIRERMAARRSMVVGQVEEFSLMQRGQGSKRHRSPTPRRRRIPLRTRARSDYSSSGWTDRRAAWQRTPSRPANAGSRPTSTHSWAAAPWRQHGRGAARASRHEDQEEVDVEIEEACEEETADATAGPSEGPEQPPVPVFDDGIRTWGELTGILDPMDEPEQLIDPAIVGNSVERMSNMQVEERQRLAIDLVRFMALMFAEVLRMMSLANLGGTKPGDASSMLQWPTPSMTRRNVRHQGLQWMKGDDAKTSVSSGKGGRKDDDQEKGEGMIPKYVRVAEKQLHLAKVEEDAEITLLMQFNVDKFGGLLQKLLGLLEKMEGPVASMRAGFLSSLLPDVQRPGPHINAAIIERMDRLQALLLSFEGQGELEMQDADRDWCLRQWEILRPPLLDKAVQTPKDKDVVVDRNASASSSDIVHLEDSQESEPGGYAQVAVLQNGTTRALTQEEQEEIAYHEELECRAAEREAKADEHRWELFRAQCLQEEDQAMKDAMEESVLEQPYKKAKVKVIVEGTGGRVVRSEVFNMVVHEGEALTYKIMVLPKNDPEIEAMRDSQAQRQQRQQGQEGDLSNVSEASADTVIADVHGRPLLAPVQISDAEMHAFLSTEEGQKYYKAWSNGEISCKQVCMRSGAGLLAKFFSRQVEEREEQKMLQIVLEAEEASKASDVEGPRAAESDQEKQSSGPTEVMAPTAWPSYSLRPAEETIQVDSQMESQTELNEGMPEEEKPASAFAGYISVEENNMELAFAIAAGDVSEGVGGDAVEDDRSTPSPMLNAGLLSTSSTGAASAFQGIAVMTGHEEQGEVMAGTEEDQGEASAGTRPTEGQNVSSTDADSGLKQTDLKHWLL